jgi:phage terminase large subunit
MTSSKPTRLSELMPIGRDGRRGPSAKQREAFAVLQQKNCLFYGGAGGGGKSFFLRWALLGLLIKWASEGHRGVSVGLFSLDYPTLKDRQIGKIAREFPDSLGELKETQVDGLCFFLKPEYGTGILKLRNLDDPAKYRSSEFAAIAVEELPENELETFHDLFWRLRWPGIPNPKFLGAGNPEGVGLWWVKQLFIDRDFTGELANLEIIKEQVAFVQALHSDNPNLEDSYETTLSTLPEMRRKAIKEGLWTVFKGQVFEEWRKEIHVVDPANVKVEDWWKCWLANDAGQAEPAAWYLFAASPDGQVYVIREWTFRDRQWHSDQAIEVVKSLKSMGRSLEMMKISGLDSFAPRFERGRGIVDVYEEGGLCGWDKPNPDSHPGRKARATMVHEYLKPFAAGDRTTAKLQVFNTCTELIRTLPMLIANPDHPEEVKESAIDHWYDALSYGLVAWHIRRSEEPVAPTYKRGTLGDIMEHSRKLELKDKNSVFR